MPIILIREMCCIFTFLYPHFPWYYISALWRAFTVNRGSAISSFSYVESFLKGVSTFIDFTVGNHSFTSYMVLSVLSTLKPIGDWKILRLKYLRTDLSWTFISKCSSKYLVGSVNDVSLLVVLIKSSVETVI